MEDTCDAQPSPPRKPSLIHRRCCVPCHSTSEALMHVSRHVVCCYSLAYSCGFTNRPPSVEGKGRVKEEADQSRWIGGRLNKQGNWLRRLVVGGCKTSRSPHLPARILKVYLKALTGFSQVWGPEGLNNTLLSQVCILENGSPCENGVEGRTLHCKDREGGEELLIVWMQPGALAAFECPPPMPLLDLKAEIAHSRCPYSCCLPRT